MGYAYRKVGFEDLTYRKKAKIKSKELHKKKVGENHDKSREKYERKLGDYGATEKA